MICFLKASTSDVETWAPCNDDFFLEERCKRPADSNDICENLFQSEVSVFLYDLSSGPGTVESGVALRRLETSSTDWVVGLCRLFPHSEQAQTWSFFSSSAATGEGELLSEDWYIDGPKLRVDDTTDEVGLLVKIEYSEELRFLMNGGSSLVWALEEGTMESMESRSSVKRSF
jgi:hypothetical protein